MRMCALDETGRNSVSPWTSPRMTALRSPWSFHVMRGLARGAVSRCAAGPQHALPEHQRVERDALVDAVEHAGEVQVRRQLQRGEAVAGDAERRERLVVGAAARAGTAARARRGRAVRGSATIASTSGAAERRLQADVAVHDDLDLDVVADEVAHLREHRVLVAGQRADVDERLGACPGSRCACSRPRARSGCVVVRRVAQDEAGGRAGAQHDLVGADPLRGRRRAAGRARRSARGRRRELERPLRAADRRRPPRRAW